MKFSIVYSGITKQLQEVCSIACSSPNKEDITQNILLLVKDHQLTLRSTDYNIEIEATIPIADVESEGAITVNASKLSESCKNLNASACISFDYDEANSKLLLKYDSIEFSIKTRPASDFPSFEKENVDQTITLQQKQLKALLDQSLFCVSNEDFRDYLKGVRFEADGNNLSIFTSDGHRMAILETPLQQNFPELYGAIMTRKCAAELSKILDVAAESSVNLLFTKNSVSTICNGFCLTSKLIVCGYPNVRSVIPKTIETSISIPREDLKVLISRVSVLSSKRVNGVTFTFNNNNLALRSENSEHEVANAQLSIPYVGNPIEISLNASYVNDILKSLKSDDVVFSFASPMASTLLTPSTEIDENGVKARYIISKVVV